MYKKTELRQALIDQSDHSDEILSKSNSGTQYEEQDQVGVQETKQDRTYIGYALVAVVCFTICNSTISHITMNAGPYSIFYLSAGAVLTGVMYYTFVGCQNYMKTGESFWVDQNIIINGKFKPRNLCALIFYMFQYIFMIFMCTVIFWFAHLAQLNVGFLTLLWSLSPFFLATVDYFCFKTKLQCNHYIGLFMIIACLLLLSMRKVFTDSDSQDTTISKSSQLLHSKMSEAPQILDEGETMPAWIPMSLAAFYALQVCSQVTTLKFYTRPEGKLKFTPMNLTMGGIMYANLIVLVIAIIFWQSHAVNWELFWMGLIAAMINTVGIVSINKAFSMGPLGIVESLACCSNFILVIVEAIKFQRMLTTPEIIAVILGFIGALELVVPEYVELFLFCKSCRRGHKKEEQ